jgi:hypothetical protein
MNDRSTVISAFLDDEPFDAGELAAALSDPDGQTLLIDLVALRHIAQPDDMISVTEPRARPSIWRPLLAAAAILVALAGGYFIGERRSAPDASGPPAATRVVQANDWQPLPAGGRQ